MPESLYCPNQKVLSNQGKKNWDKIEWDKNKWKVSFVYGPPISDEISRKYRKTLINGLDRSFNSA